VSALHQVLGLELLEVASDGGGGHPERIGEVADRPETALGEGFDDLGLT
jgi:hypothetical protein